MVAARWLLGGIPGTDTLKWQFSETWFEPQSHPRWQIVEISNRPPNLSPKQSELTVRTQKTFCQGKNLSAKEKALFCPKIAQKFPKFAKICLKFSPKEVPKTICQKLFLTMRYEFVKNFFQTVRQKSVCPKNHSVRPSKIRLS